MKGYYLAFFDTWEGAVAFQKERLEYCLSQEWPIRATELNSDLDFDRKIRVYSAFVRAYVMDNKKGPW